MPITFIDIEREKSWRICLLFCLLAGIYLLFSFVALQVVLVFFLGMSSFFVIRSPGYALAISLFSLSVAAVHFVSSGYIAVQRVVEQVRASDPDPDDSVHRQLMNVMDEIAIASGNRRKISCLVIPTLSMNALAVTDLRGRAVIAITEGLLARLTRPQIEAVMAHEAYHVLSGDCLETSLATSLFGIYASAADNLRESGREDPRAWPLFFIFWVLARLSSLVGMFISREREYRADAGAVRMTRNPLALAEALDIISDRWTGSGFISEGLEMLCISSPAPDSHDEGEGIWYDLMSTHPPIRSRIEVLLRMAHAGPSALKNRDVSGPAVQEDGPLFFARDPENLWQGPFLISELATFPWFSPQTWISDSPEGSAVRVAQHPAAGELFRSIFGGSPAGGSGMLCPRCRQPLVSISEAGTSVNRCNYCRGLLADNDKITRILARSRHGCSDRILALVRAVTADNQRSLLIRQKRLRQTRTQPAMVCPACGREMFRSFYSYAFLIELDRCGVCRHTWFDADELEMLKCLIESGASGA